MTNDALRRAARTFFQGVIGVLVLLAIPILNQLIQSVAAGERATVDLDVWQSIAIASVAGGVIALIAFLLLRLAQATQERVESPLAFARLVRSNLMHRRRLADLERPPPKQSTDTRQIDLFPA